MGVIMTDSKITKQTGVSLKEAASVANATAKQDIDDKPTRVANLHLVGRVLSTNLSPYSDTTFNRGRNNSLLSSRSTGSIVSPSTMLQGILRKQERGILKRLKKRWFILGDIDDFLRYYSTTQSGSVLGEINIACVIDVRYLKGDKGPKECPYGFQITTPERAYFLFAESTAARQMWCDGLNLRVEQLKRQSTVIKMLSSPVPQTSMMKPTTSINPSSKVERDHANTLQAPSRPRPLARSQSFGPMELDTKVISVHTDEKTSVTQATQTPSSPISIETSIISNYNYKKERSEKIKTLRKTDSFSTSVSHNFATSAPLAPSVNGVKGKMGDHGGNSDSGSGGGSGISISLAPSHRRKKSCGKIQDDINEYVKISRWMQNLEKDRALKGATETR